VIQSPTVQGVSLTGSDSANAAVAQEAGRQRQEERAGARRQRSFIVLDGERMQRTLDAAVKGRLSNTGHSCVASKRFIVLADVYDACWPGCATASRRCVRAIPPIPTTFGPLSSERAAQTLIAQVEDAVANGATALLGGGRPDLPGAFVEPTILTGVTPTMRAYDEELFGPVAVVHRVTDEDEAVSLANDSPYGLGGVKRSGFGRELAELGMREFANRELICTVAPDAPIGNFAG
jgi:succinate-semialdehyde dehydrogenase / glutarate-semialdehyde dehydrogenase